MKAFDLTFDVTIVSRSTIPFLMQTLITDKAGFIGANKQIHLYEVKQNKLLESRFKIFSFKILFISELVEKVKLGKTVGKKY